MALTYMKEFFSVSGDCVVDDFKIKLPCLSISFLSVYLLTNQHHQHVMVTEGPSFGVSLNV